MDLVELKRFCFPLSFLITLLVPAGLVFIIKINPVLVRKERVPQKWYLIALGLLLPGLVGLAAVLTPAYVSARVSAAKSNCYFKMKDLALSVILYSADYDDRLPLAANWVDEAELIAEDRDREIPLECPSYKGPCGYALNRVLCSELYANLWSPSDTVMVFESDTDTKNAIGSLGDVAPRHLDRPNFAFADGHVKSMNVTRANTLRWDISNQDITSRASLLRQAGLGK